ASPAPCLPVDGREARAEERPDPLGGGSLVQAPVVLLQDVSDVVRVAEQIEPTQAEGQADGVAVRARRLEKETPGSPARRWKGREQWITARARGCRCDASASRHSLPSRALTRVRRRRRPPFPSACADRSRRLRPWAPAPSSRTSCPCPWSPRRGRPA